jgi:sensor histidine kinase YesM
VTENPAGAQKYISDMSKVYRYLLRTNDHELTTLANEWLFIESYFHLLQTRFGKGVELVTEIQPAHTSLLLPPLTLQLLVENAVKHNTVGKNKPLRIEIISSESQVTVRNNLQKKYVKVESNKVGLSNIAEKYRLINKSDIEVSEENGFFSVSVPLIAAIDSD